jgi:hypothetical protein
MDEFTPTASTSSPTAKSTPYVPDTRPSAKSQTTTNCTDCPGGTVSVNPVNATEPLSDENAPVPNCTSPAENCPSPFTSSYNRTDNPDASSPVPAELIWIREICTPSIDDAVKLICSIDTSVAGYVT